MGRRTSCPRATSSRSSARCSRCRSRRARVEYVKAEDISEEARAKERALEMKSEDLEGKPDAIKEKMVEGRVNKMFKEKILLDQKYIKDDSMTVADFVASYVAVLGENIQVARFGTFRLGETQDA